MCGMKTGAGEDPFADVEGDEDRSGDSEAADAPRDTDTDRPGRRGRSRDEPPGRDRSSSDQPGDASSDRRGGAPSDGQAADEPDERVRPSELPYIARRNARGDNVKAGRDARRLFELRPQIAEQEDPFLEELARQLGEEVPKTDAREAALAIVYDRPELVADKLEEWGVNYFEE